MNLAIEAGMKTAPKSFLYSRVMFLGAVHPRRSGLIVGSFGCL
jgi:hypothetical protein